ncbi:MAG: cobalt ECF transporter T component CbiQ [Peptococcaceae bacterium]|nr:cobalt ECF transporter T component CbiQ [Peptococcaceae bacterium]
MSGMINSLYNLRLLDDLAKKGTSIHRVHPLIKLLTTVVYLTVVVSFGRYQISGLMPFLFYPVLIFALGEVPVLPILKRIIIVEPLIIGIGILNPIFDHQTFMFGGFTVSMGWVTFLSIMIKCALTVTVALLLVATTGMDGLAAAMRMLKIPKAFVLQLVLTYRYIAVLLEEAARTLRAYSLRAPGQRGIHRSAWGTLAGQLLLRTFDRAERVYQGMCLKGFTGEYYTGKSNRIRIIDLFFLAGWISFFVIARIYNIPMLLGSLLTGVLN